MPLTDAQIVDEYHALCREYGYPSGTSLRILLSHHWRQGAQVAALIPSQGTREHLADRHDFLEGT